MLVRDTLVTLLRNTVPSNPDLVTFLGSLCKLALAGVEASLPQVTDRVLERCGSEPMLTAACPDATTLGHEAIVLTLTILAALTAIMQQHRASTAQHTVLYTLTTKPTTTDRRGTQEHGSRSVPLAARGVGVVAGVWPRLVVVRVFFFCFLFFLSLSAPLSLPPAPSVLSSDFGK